jgi:serine/threonine protein kinase
MFSWFSSPKIIIEKETYKKTSICNNARLIDTFNLRSIIGNFKFTCDSTIKYSTLTLLGTGAGNMVYSIDGGDTKVLRIRQELSDMIEGHKINDSLRNRLNQILNTQELTGLILQAYMSSPTGAGCPNICAVYEFGYAEKNKNKYAYAVIEKLKNPDLSKVITELQKNCTEKVFNSPLLPIFKGALEALKCIHAKRIVHMDIKRENIGIDAEGNAKIFDFSCANHIPINKSNIKVEDSHCGTLFNMDPNYRNNNVISINSDIYSLGAVILETYFTDVEDKETKQIKLTPGGEWPERLYYDSVFDHEKPSLLEDLLKKMLHPDPTKRCTSEEALNHEWFLQKAGGKRKKNNRKTHKHIFRKNRTVSYKKYNI